MAKKKEEANGLEANFGQVVFFQVRCEGTAALLMHNIRLADQDDDFVIAIKEITGKRTKTREDRELLKRLEFEDCESSQCFSPYVSYQP